ncbi:hypothetical protein K438DRAFT_1989831 [Mycena galopus ATCC 62051]|nr:hypothetical protein K438DRAFT_1989831 [Mycena galopus ATCC 62051]
MRPSRFSPNTRIDFMMPDSEARIDLLRERAGVKGSTEVATDETMQPAVLPATDGHINLFKDLEHSFQNPIATVTAKKIEPVVTERDVLLAPSAIDLTPWYTESRTAKPDQEEAGEKRIRDTPRKSVRDPLTSIMHQLAAQHTSTPTSTAYIPKHTYPPRRPPNANAQTNTITAQLSEREMRGSETPSSIHGGGGGGCNDVFNRREVEEAHRGREKRDPR